MKPEKVWDALERYEVELAAVGADARQFTEPEYDVKAYIRHRQQQHAGVEVSPTPVFSRLSEGVMLAHCRWMAQTCLNTFRPEYEAAKARVANAGRPPEAVAAMWEAFKPLGKAMRWLCYIQGVCNALGVYSCNELRDHSRGKEGQFQTPAEEHGIKVESVNVRPVFAAKDMSFVETDGFSPVAVPVNRFGFKVADRTAYVTGDDKTVAAVRAIDGSHRAIEDAVDAAAFLADAANDFVRSPRRGERWEKHVKPYLPTDRSEPAEPAGADRMLETAADILGLSADVRDTVIRQVKLKKAVETPEHRRTVEQVELLQRSVYGCCDRHADRQGCDCLSVAQTRGATA